MEFDILSSLVQESLRASSLPRECHKGALTLVSLRNLAAREKLSGRADLYPEASPFYLVEAGRSQALRPLLRWGGPSWVLAASHGPPSALHPLEQDP